MLDEAGRKREGCCVFLGVLPADLLRDSGITGGLEEHHENEQQHWQLRCAAGRSNSMQKGLSHRLFLSASKVAADASFGIALGVAWIPL